jgi:hypothetical protein
MGMFTDTSTNPSICRVPRPSRGTSSRSGEAILCRVKAVLPHLFGIWRSEKSAHPGAEKCHKRLENIADNPAGEDAAVLGPISLPDRTPAKTHMFTNSCAEPDFTRSRFSSFCSGQTLPPVTKGNSRRSTNMRTPYRFGR